MTKRKRTERLVAERILREVLPAFGAIGTVRRTVGELPWEAEWWGDELAESVQLYVSWMWDTKYIRVYLPNRRWLVRLYYGGVAHGKGFKVSTNGAKDGTLERAKLTELALGIVQAIAAALEAREV